MDITLFGDLANSTVCYVGPAGLGAMGVLLVVILVALLGAVGLVLHPIRLFLKHRRQQALETGVSDSGSVKADS